MLSCRVLLLGKTPQDVYSSSSSECAKVKRRFQKRDGLQTLEWFMTDQGLCTVLGQQAKFESAVLNSNVVRSATSLARMEIASLGPHLMFMLNEVNKFVNHRLPKVFMPKSFLHCTRK
jgi:hypothetical protein